MELPSSYLNFHWLVFSICSFISFNSRIYNFSQEKDSDTYVLVGADEIQGELADSHMALQGMLQSRHAAEVRGEAEIWSDTLQQVCTQLLAEWNYQIICNVIFHINKIFSITKIAGIVQ